MSSGFGNSQSIQVQGHSESRFIETLKSIKSGSSVFSAVVVSVISIALVAFGSKLIQSGNPIGGSILIFFGGIALVGVIAAIAALAAINLNSCFNSRSDYSSI